MSFRMRRLRPSRGAVTCVTLALAVVLVGGCTPAGVETQPDTQASEPHDVLVRGQDYAFEFDDPPAGMVRFAFENVGEVPHEVVIVQLEDGVTGEQMAAALQGQSDPEELVAGVVGILIADPGQTAPGTLVAELETDRVYAMLCTFTDTEDAPPHIALGMMRIFRAS